MPESGDEYCTVCIPFNMPSGPAFCPCALDRALRKTRRVIRIMTLVMCSWASLLNTALCTLAVPAYQNLLEFLAAQCDVQM